MEGRFVEEDVLYWRTFCMCGRFVEGRSVEGRSVEGRLVGRTFCSGGHFVKGRFVLVPVPQFLPSVFSTFGNFLPSVILQYTNGSNKITL